MLDREKCEEFVRWVFEHIEQGYDLDGFEMQHKLLDCGLVERRDVNPEENDWGADSLYFLKETDKCPS